MKKLLAVCILSAAAFANLGLCAQQTLSPIEREVRHELVMLPYYSVFDDLSFQVNGTTVILNGKVVRPTLKDDAERVVKRIEGVQQVENHIEVLPLSPNDDQIRMATYRAIYSFASMYRYAQQAVPSIHIIVENGKVTLEGVVDNNADRDTANLRAQTVPGTFAVTNHLRVDNGTPQKGK